RSADGLGPEAAGMDWKDAHILGFFYDPALALHKDYATKLLTPTNRFTGLSLAQDPAVAFVEIINENGLLQKWLDGGLDRLPPRYATNLQARWNAWLDARYPDESAMLAAWNVINQPLDTNLLSNGDFSNHLTFWVAEQHNNARAGFTRTYDFTGSQPSAKVAVTNADTTGWYIQLNQPGIKVTSNQVYTISFWAKSSPATNADAAVMRAHDDYAALGYSRGLGLTTNWQQFTNTFQGSATDTNARVNFGSMGDKPATFWFADVRLQAGGQIGMLPPGTSLAAHTVPNLVYTGNGYTGTPEARRDWLRFLRDLEYNYYDTMVAHVRTHCGYPGLIFGTIMANSPATVQSRLEVIDGHAYWQHPQFPGAPWDPVNWFQPNVSMVNTVGDDNTLASLARQRIKGKPFTVTEYEHPAPNYHGAESPLLLAAYAGLQDWDGLWLFAYGPGNDTAPTGYVRGFFELAQHPTKMANLLLAANLFRRGDVRPALQEYSLALTPERELDLLQTTWAWNLFSSRQLGMPGKLAFISRLSTSAGTNAPGLTTPPTAPPGNVLTSDTGELIWNGNQPSQGRVTFDTARTKALIGFADNQTPVLPPRTLRPGPTQLGWSTLGATLTRGEVFTNDCTMLAVAGGWWENTGQVWTDASQTSLGNQWGHAPVLTEVVPFTLTLPVATNHVQAWSLDERGQRKAALVLTGNATNTTLTITTNAGSIWYELAVARWTTSFDLWRLRYFGAEALADPAISGAAARPDAEGVPNLLKYYLGLPGRTPAPAGSLPTGSLITVSNQLHLAMTYTHDKLATDVDCVPEVSTDLVNWLSGPATARVEAIVDQGAQEQITVQDLMPVANSTHHFMRLRFQQR
ncbi:MAG: carbohydrate binding domain-containing protein, partial [Verrucomicrobia subdivision 3 bacterium]|nr:carbohydrate binding domain-containing protein [Limisphaerales bacterium]